MCSSFLKWLKVSIFVDNSYFVMEERVDGATDSASVVNNSDTRLDNLEKKFDDFMEMLSPLVKKRKLQTPYHDISEPEDGGGVDSEGDGDDTESQEGHSRDPTGLADALLNEHKNTSESDCEEGEFAVDLSQLESQLSGAESQGPAIMANVASIGNKVFENPIPPAQVKEIEQKFAKPSNLNKILVPKVNPGVWNKVPRLNKAADLKFQTLQQHLVKASTAIMMATESAMKVGEKDCTNSSRKQLSADMVKGLVDATALLGRTCHELSLMRRVKLKPVMKRQYVGLCSDSVPVTEFLFGDDISKSAKDIRQTEDVCRDMDHSGYSGYSGYSGFKRRNFGGQYHHAESKNWTGRGRGRGRYNNTKGRYNKFPKKS